MWLSAPCSSKETGKRLRIRGIISKGDVTTGAITSGDICIADLTVNAEKDGPHTERGAITLENVAGTVTAGEGFSALKSEKADAQITVNGTVLTEAVGASVVIGE